MEMVLSRCVVRSFRPDDAPSLERHANNRSVWINLRDQFPHPYSLADAERWIREAAALDPETHFAIAVDGAAAGAIGFDLVRLYAGVFEGNRASMRVLEKAGYTREARLRKGITKDGRTIDLVLYAMVRE